MNLPETAVHLQAFLELRLDADLEGGLVVWEQAFAAARNKWQLFQARQLLALIKRYPLTPQQRASLNSLEGHFLSQQADWPAAVTAYENALSLRPDEADALSGLGNALRRIPGRAPEAIPCYKQALAQAKSAERPAILNNLGLAYYETGDLEQAATIFAEALQAFHTAGNRQCEADVLHNLGSLFWTQGQLETAVTHFTTANTLYEEIGQRHAQAESLNSLGLVQEARGDWQTAVQSYREALLIFQQVGDDNNQMQALANLGNALTLLHDYETADTCFVGGLAIARDLSDARLEGQLLNGLAELRQAQGNTTEALELFEQAIDRKQAANDTRSMKHTWLSLGALYRQIRQPIPAQKAYEQALAAARMQNDRRIQAHSLMGLAQIAHAQERLDVLRTYLDRAEFIAGEMGYEEVQAEASRIRADLELLKQEPDYRSLLIHYTEALVHAHNFNEITFQNMMVYLVDLITAIAEDGQLEEAVQMAADLNMMGQTVSLPTTAVSRFQTLARQLQPD